MNHFSKQDLILLNQCEKALWLKHHKPELAAPPDEGSKLRLDQGHQVDAKAREVYAGGHLIQEPGWEASIEKTQKHIKAGVSRLYQPAFEYYGLRMQADILDIHQDGSVILREVKMSTKPKDEHLIDVATQAYILQGVGFSIKSVFLVLINNEHTPENGTPIFHETDVTQAALKGFALLNTAQTTLSSTLDSADMPEVAVGKHCTKPWKCSFYGHCWTDIPEASVHSIPRLSQPKMDALRNQSITRLEHIPKNFALTKNQWDYVQFQTAGTPVIDVKAIQEEIASFVYPLYFLDFETHSAPVPPFPRTRPYQQVPFQFSLHILEANRTLNHHGYLHTDPSDPRLDVANHLLEYIGDQGTILTYNASFEKKVLSELAAEFPTLTDRIHQLIHRVYDQLPLIKNNVKDPALNRSYSLKTITKVFLEEVSYAGLPIANGETAHASWVKLHSTTSPKERAAIIKALEDYCCQDTLAQVHLHYWCENLV